MQRHIDLAAWATLQAEAIKQGRWDVVDRANVADELLDVAKLCRRELYARLVDSARLAIRGQSPALEGAYRSLEESPSLSSELPALIKEAVAEACKMEGAEAIDHVIEGLLAATISLHITGSTSKKH